MQAVIVTGGKQYCVEVGQKFKFEKLPVEIGDNVTFEQVLMVSHEGRHQIGMPHVSGVTVKGTALQQGRHKKIHIIKFKRRKHHMKRMGHRQDYTEVEITDIQGATV